MNPILDVFVKVAKDGKAEFGVWMIVDGAMVSGLLTSSDKVFMKIYEHPLFDFMSPDEKSAVIKDMAEKKNIPTEQKPEKREVISLINVNIRQSQATIHAPWIIIETDHISAWGLGEISQ